MTWTEYYFCLWGPGRQRITRDWRIVLKKENGKKGKRIVLKKEKEKGIRND